MSVQKRKPKKALIQFALAAVVAIVLGIGAVALTYILITNVSTQAQEQAKAIEEEKLRLAEENERLKRAQQQATVISYKEVQAALDLSPGQPITKEMITLVDVDTRPDPTAMTRLSDVVGKVAKTAILSGSVLRRTELTDADGWVQVPEGMRAITIQVDNVAGLNGALTPGSFVDILTTLSNGDETLTKTLLQNIQVISTGGSSGGTATSRSSGGSNGAVTLSVSPKQAEMLTLANSLGKFHLTLRNFKDKTKSTIKGSDLHELLTGRPATNTAKMPVPPMAGMEPGMVPVNFSPGGQLPEPAVLKKEPSFSMQVLRGTGSETVKFD